MHSSGKRQAGAHVPHLQQLACATQATAQPGAARVSQHTCPAGPAAPSPLLAGRPASFPPRSGAPSSCSSCRRGWTSRAWAGTAAAATATVTASARHTAPDSLISAPFSHLFAPPLVPRSAQRCEGPAAGCCRGRAMAGSRRPTVPRYDLSPEAATDRGRGAFHCAPPPRRGLGSPLGRGAGTRVPSWSWLGARGPGFFRQAPWSGGGEGAVSAFSTRSPPPLHRFSARTDLSFSPFVPYLFFSLRPEYQLPSFVVSTHQWHQCDVTLRCQCGILILMQPRSGIRESICGGARMPHVVSRIKLVKSQITQWHQRR